MAEATVESAMDNLKQLLLYHPDLIREARSQVEDLEYDLRLLRAFLDKIGRQAKNNHGCSSSSSDLVKEIRSIVHEMEDAIDTYITERTAYDKSKTSIVKKVLGGQPKLMIEDSREKVKSALNRGKIELARNITATAAETEIATPLQAMAVMKDKVVAFEDEVQTIIDFLTEETEELDVVSIVGMPGLGKTTLAREIFRDPKIKCEFPTRVWVYVSQVFNKKDVFLAILNELTTNSENPQASITDQELVQMLRESLKEGKFLIVLDDIWTAEAWMDLRDAFPKLNKAGKLLITSRNVEVARFANPNRAPHQLRLLNLNESWELLQWEVFGRQECPPELEAYGKLIAEKCHGLPLAIMMIGGILVKQSESGDTTVTPKDAWRKVSESFHTHLKEDANYNVENMVALSYNNLPYYLRPCFLYLGMFPEGFDIPVWTLIRLWIAEGFIQERASLTLEQIAQDYLAELIDHSLVMVARVRADGLIKTCCIHNVLRDFCIKESGSEKENSFQEFTESAEAAGGFMPPITMLETCRRVCIHSKVVVNNFLSSKPTGPWVRSFLCFSKEGPFSLLYENTSSIFKLLKIFEAKPILFAKLPRDLASLVHLKYIVMSIDFKVIPEAIAELWNLQTLVIYTLLHIIEIKANIWKMIQLRHVKTNAPTILPDTDEKVREAGERLQTLGAILPESCTEDVFDIVPNLETLCIRGSLVKLLDSKGLDRLGKLEKLKLVNDSDHGHSGVSSAKKLPQLPYAHKFPPNLRWLTLSATQLDWEHMSTLAMLDNLKVLKLKDKAFMGEQWKMSDYGYFFCLEVLYIEDTDLVTWEGERTNFPRLKRLRLRSCTELETVPHTLGDAESFERLDLIDVKQSVVDSAWKIKETKRYASAASTRNKFQIHIAGSAGNE